MGYRDKHPYIRQILIVLKHFINDKANRFTWMFKVEDCHSICMFCEYYEICKRDGSRRVKK